MAIQPTSTPEKWPALFKNLYIKSKEMGANEKQITELEKVIREITMSTLFYLEFPKVFCQLYDIEQILYDLRSRISSSQDVEKNATYLAEIKSKIESVYKSFKRSTFDFPPEIISMIFEYALENERIDMKDLEKWSLLSPQCNIAIQSPSLIANLLSLRAPEEGQLVHLAKRAGPRLTHLCLHHYKVIPSEMNEVIKFCPNIIDLNLISSSISDEVLSAIGSNYPKLESINLSGCYDLTSFRFQTFFSQCKKLRRYFGEIDNSTAMGLAHNGQTLKVLSISGPTLTSVGLNIIANNCNQLRVVEIWGGVYRSEQDIVVFLTKLPNIEKLSIFPVSNAGWEALAKGCPAISELAIKGHEKFDLMVIATHFPGLRIFSCYGQFPKADLTAFIRMMPNLTDLYLDNNNILTDLSYDQAVQSVQTLQKEFPQVHISYGKDDPFKMEVGPSILRWNPK